MAVNFSKNQDEITKAWRNVTASNNEQRWALYGYEATTNVIRLMATGSKGLEELVQEFNCSLIQYAFCRVIDSQLGLNKLILINWQGESAPLSRKGLCASHVGDVANYFKGCAQTITIRNDDEATKEHLMDQIMKTSASKINLSRQQVLIKSMDASISSNNRVSEQQQRSAVNNASSSEYKSDIASDMAANRKSFWQRQEEEEKQRLAEEKRLAAEKQAQFERESKQREESEARKLAQTIEQRDRLIDATRQADLKASTNSNNSAASSTCSNSQPSSIISSGAQGAGDDDGCVGRRSELIRLERNQETQSLISKGLIKNKRAIFENQTNQGQEQQRPTTTLSRRSSGTIITQRLNAFKSMSISSSSPASTKATASPSSKSVVNKLANGFTEKMSLNGDESTTASNDSSSIQREVETVKLTNDEDQNLSHVSYNNDNSTNNDIHDDMNAHKKHETPRKAGTPAHSKDTIRTNSPKANPTPEKQAVAAVAQEVNGNSRLNSSPAAARTNGQDVSSGTPETTNNDEAMLFGSKQCEAIALFDYEAADSTEISFDPDDKIGFIQKVDPGWWQGKVMSGRFKEQIGLFPSNYVKEI